MDMLGLGGSTPGAADAAPMSLEQQQQEQQQPAPLQQPGPLGASDDVFDLPVFTGGLVTPSMLPEPPQLSGFGALPPLSGASSSLLLPLEIGGPMGVPLEFGGTAADVSDQGLFWGSAEWPQLQPLSLALEPLLAPSDAAAAAGTPAAAASLPLFGESSTGSAAATSSFGVPLHERTLWERALGLAGGLSGHAVGAATAPAAHMQHRSPPLLTPSLLPPAFGGSGAPGPGHLPPPSVNVIAEMARLALARGGAAAAAAAASVGSMGLAYHPATGGVEMPPSLRLHASAAAVTGPVTLFAGDPMGCGGPGGTSAAAVQDADEEPFDDADDGFDDEDGEDGGIDDLLADVFSLAVGT